MAKTQGSGMSWMIASAILGIAFFFTLILAIIFYTRVDAAQKQAAADSTALRVWVSSAEANAPNYELFKTEAREKNESVVARLNAHSEWLKETMGVGKESTTEEIRQRLTTAGVEEGTNLLGTINRLKAELANNNQLITQYKANLDKAQQEARTATAAQVQAAKDFTSSTASLKRQLDTMSGEFNAFKDQTSKSANTLIGSRDEEHRAALNTIAQQKSTVDQLQAQNQILQRKIEQLTNEKERLGGTIDPSLLADGRVSSVLANSQVVYIDLGRKDRVVLGMTFEVFDAASGVTKDESGESRGKATLEVVNVLDNASVCRVVRRDSGRELVVGDVIANGVYDPKMKFNFYIFGDFDLENTGQPTLTDRRRIEGMITSWGGRVINTPGSGQDTLSPETDFLILGQEPPLPQEPRDKTDPVTIENFNRAKAKYETYQNLLVEARRLSIPVLNQNRFLVMVGYYQR